MITRKTRIVNLDISRRIISGLRENLDARCNEVRPAVVGDFMDLTDFEILSISGIGPSGFLAWKGVVSAVKEHEQTEKARKIIEDEEVSEINAFGDFSNILVEIAATHKALADKYLELASIITPSGNYYE